VEAGVRDGAGAPVGAPRRRVPGGRLPDDGLRDDGLRDDGLRDDGLPDDEPASDGALARRAALGDREAFAQIFHRHAEAMHRYATHMLHGHPDDAEDAVQAALVKAWQHLPSYRGEASLRTWLFTITANEVRGHRRKVRPTPVDDQLLVDRPAPRSTSDPASVLLQAELWEVLSVALGELPWRQRASWVLRELEDFSYEDIAVVLGTTPTVIRGQLHRARRSVAVRMDQWR